MTPICLRAAFACFLFASTVPSGVLVAQERRAAPQVAADVMKAWYAFYHHEAAHAYRFKLEPGNAELEFDPTAIMRWTNPLEEGDIHGVGYVWRLAGRPVVIGQLFSYLNGNGGRVYCHAMHSLARNNEKLTGLRDGVVFWTPDSPGVEMSDVPDAPAPANSRAARLTQMKAISRRFSAYTDEANRGKRILRLLPTPLDRLRGTASESEDGALFSFVVGNDPEVILLVEQNEEAGGASVWQFGLVRSTRSTAVAMLDEREIWRYDSTDKNPADLHNGYLSVHGIGALPLEPPVQPAQEP